MDVAEIQVTVTDELKNIQKGDIWQFFRKYKTAQKPVYMTMELISN